MHEAEAKNIWEKISGFISPYNVAAWQTLHTIYLFLGGESHECYEKASSVRDALKSLSKEDESPDKEKFEQLSTFIRDYGVNWYNLARGKRRDTEVGDRVIEGIRIIMLKDLSAMSGNWKNYPGWP